MITLIEPSGFGRVNMEETNSCCSWWESFIIFLCSSFCNSEFNEISSEEDREHGRAWCFEGTFSSNSIMSPLTIWRISTSLVSFCHSGKQLATPPAVKFFASLLNWAISTKSTNLFTCFVVSVSSLCGVTSSDRGSGTVAGIRLCGGILFLEGLGPGTDPSRSLKKADWKIDVPCLVHGYPRHIRSCSWD